MSVATVSQIRTALADQLIAALPEGVQVHDVLPGQMNPPAIVVRRQLTTFDTTMYGESNDVTLSVIVFVQFAAPVGAQGSLDAYLSPAGPYSIAASVNADPTLGGVVDWAVATEAGNDEIVSYGGVDYLSGTVTVVVG